MIAGLLPNVVPDPAVSFTSIGFCFNVCVGTSSLTRNTVPVVASVNEATLTLNLTVSFCSGVQVPPFCDLNILDK